MEKYPLGEDFFFFKKSPGSWENLGDSKSFKLKNESPCTVFFSGKTNWGMKDGCGRKI